LNKIVRMKEKQSLKYFNVECLNTVSIASIRGKKWLHHHNVEGSSIDTAVGIGAEAAAAAGIGTELVKRMLIRKFSH
jgi:hypothetical protein